MLKHNHNVWRLCKGQIHIVVTVSAIQTVFVVKVKVTPSYIQHFVSVTFHQLIRMDEYE